MGKVAYPLADFLEKLGDEWMRPSRENACHERSIRPLIAQRR
jgi:hypothetical protein